MRRQAVTMVEPGRVEVREETLEGPAPGQLLVQTLVSAISSGTEMLFYRGQVPAGMQVDETLPALGGQLEYPLKYGYAAVGRVVELGDGVPKDWRGRTVFAFRPHESHFTATPGEVLRVEGGISSEGAAFLPNMETAVTLLLDGQPLAGEQVAVFGQGVVGLLMTALLAQMPLASLVTLDRYASRRALSLEMGACASLDPAAPDAAERLRSLLRGRGAYEGADLAFELSGAPQALDQAIAATGYSGRVVIGSWYGQERAALDLGGRFHRSRMRLISSQVSTIAPELRGRWTTARRYALAWQMIRRVKPARLITHRFPIARAAEAYALLDQHPERAVQVLLTYG